MTTYAGDRFFTFAWSITGVINSSGSVFQVNPSPILMNVRIDDIYQADGGDGIGGAVGDNVNVIGDIYRDQFTASSNGSSGNYSFISIGQTLGTPPGLSYGIVANKIGTQSYYYFSDINPALFSNTILSVAGSQSICFMAGTQISTPNGYVNVEHLAVGNSVLTADGRVMSVRWIGRQTILTAFVDDTRLPVRVRSGALGDSIPCRDLLLSSDHALRIGEVLVQAGALINNVTITRERNVPPIFVYYHIELDDHSLIIAENVPAETFVDNVDRCAFDNWAEYQSLYPEGRSVPEMDLPRVKAHRQLPGSVRRLLAEREALLADQALPV